MLIILYSPNEIKFISRLKEVSFRRIQDYEYGRTTPSFDILQKIIQEFQIEPDYFFETNCRSLAEVLNQNQIVPKSKNLSLNQNITDSLVDQKAFVSQDNELSHYPSLTMPTKPTAIQIPVYDEVYASAGEGLLNDEHISRHISIEKDFLRDYFGLMSFLGLSIITSRGDSMSPTIPENCQLLIQQSDQFQEGQICVVRLDNELYVKRLQKRPKYKLISDNKNYDDIELENEDYEILGVVVGFFKRTI